MKRIAIPIPSSALVTAALVAAALAITALTGGATGAFAQPAGFDHGNPQGRQLVLRLRTTEVSAIAAQYGLDLLATAPANGDTLAVVQAPSGMTAEQTAGLLQGDARVATVETKLGVELPAAPLLTGGVAGEATADLLQTGTATGVCPGLAAAPVWNGYANQEAANKIELAGAQLAAPGCGSALVAVIDTGVDPSHPVLAGALVPGYDFLTEHVEIASEWTELEQSVIPIVEGVFSMIMGPVEQATLTGRGELLMLNAGFAPIVDSGSGATIAGQGLPAYFGHGTMVAGLVHLAAPAARIMPLRVFNGDGRAHLFDVVRAIYFAVDHGAEVINMSFTIESSSPELERAVRYARNHGVVCVAAAGNSGERTRVYPAALAEVVGVASTHLDDTLCEFSNYGPVLATLAAPGAGVISTYPGGLYAAGWGTSFATPLVTGTVALLARQPDSPPSLQQQQLVNALKQGAVRLDELAGDVASGRLDALGAVLAAAR